MALDIDSTRPLRSSTQLTALAHAVFRAHPSDEQRFVEWKGSLALDKSGKEGHFSIAKCVLAMANRSVEEAATHFGGCGYMVIGVAPGSVSGVSVPDMADLEPWVRRYAGDDGPVWSGRTVSFMGETVLIVTIEPPADGDPIYPLRRTWAPDDRSKKSYQEGTVFVRHQARSEPASAADVMALQRRLLAGPSGSPRIEGITVALTPPNPIQVLALVREDIDLAVDAERERLTLPAERPPVGGTGFFNHDLLVPSNVLEKYEEEREEYLKRFRAALPTAVLNTALRNHEDTATVQLTNTSNQPLQDIQIRLYLPEDVRAYEDPSDIPGRLSQPPLPPSGALPLGTLAALNLFPRTSLPSDIPRLRHGVRISKNRREVVFTVASLHPRDSVETESFILLAFDQRTRAEKTLHGPRSAQVVVSAGNRSDVVETSLEMETTGTTWVTAQLIDR